MGVCTHKFADDGTGYVRAEASPNYLPHPWAAERVRNHLDDIKFIIMLRGGWRLLFNLIQ